PSVRVIGFPRLCGVMVADYARQTGVDVVALDTGADITKIRSLLPKEIGIQGNLDPVALLAGGEALKNEILAICAAGQGMPHIFNLGHGILPETPVEHVEYLVHTLRNNL
ncbi:MAG: uroporphyrinogen decarboxylase, partial [Acetobacter sp.]|nr:uroporphyrinogen decarboxylase [Acetobacter sp.]